MFNFNILFPADHQVYARLNASAVAFMARHELVIDRHYILAYPYVQLEATIDALLHSGPSDHEFGLYLNRLWLRCFKRAVQHDDATAISYGYVGFYS
jgi:hypothetical protein